MRNDPIIGRVNHQLGYGIAGHSMGGQATARCSIRASNYNIRAAVLLHPFADSNEHIGDQIQVPLLGLTGTEDGCCGEEATRHYYDDANVPKSLANMIGIQHTEPNVPNSIWEAYLAAWFKIYMEGDRGEYYSLIYNRANPDGLCQYYPSVTCVHQNV
jgi:pimeloyl-ACP methyl ester carboxylesterase